MTGNRGNDKMIVKKLNQVHSIHFTGIKGVGMTALACCAQDLGIKISGSDIDEVFVTDATLKKRKIKWLTGFRPKNIDHPDLLIATGAHGGLTNPEVTEAKKKKIPVMTHGEALGLFMKNKIGISVCGVGGKTTTAAILATIVHYNKVPFSYAVGVGEIFPLGAPGHCDKKGNLFIAEADEYANSVGVDNRPRFFWQNPKFIICTNIEHDHPDIYKDINATQKVFLEFFQKIPKDGYLIINGDNSHNLEVLKSFSGPYYTYGIGEKNDWKVKNIKKEKEKNTFSVYFKNKRIGNFKINVPGQFNILNATATIILSQILKIPIYKIKKGLEQFKGTKRRFEFIGEKNQIKVYDDYAHHPMEIKNTLRSARHWFGKNSRIIVIFQSHTYSRTKKLLPQFAQSFSDANKVIITKIYASSREKKDLKISGQILANAIKKYHQRVNFVHNPYMVPKLIKKIIQKKDIIITMGAGDIWKIDKKIIEIL
ncbi:UDP-N-acetylmuramate--L-alanine ligase [Candidatus Shapirobacteria bacterium CG09_land_8_20_14_0_10_38_17]|uniref:UDP-N-acetylmuramate--L-alanine ligase n=1 Tax=Candidatus Shapirobacteria bacterium CG09_land_8_20_14_0_10_38_17 TaxID=1974884 RepID=A0A2H0WRA9_9BACT|nr:MAG: UDP-N-acetylmuramate--L-alanine ligase [Candidatus Shapirobacteria bacterium CG09_land_8_20_14_0_10_38_17]